MTAKNELLAAHEAMSLVLDAKFANVPEWKAFRAIDRALLALELEQGNVVKRPEPAPQRVRLRLLDGPPSYNALTEQALQEKGKPIATSDLIDFIGKHRNLGLDLDKAKINVTSGLSKSDKFKSVPWEGGRAWWFANQPVPRTSEAASMLGIRSSEGTSRVATNVPSASGTRRIGACAPPTLCRCAHDVW